MIGLTLGAYFSRRFCRMILAVFLTLFGTIYIVDLIEMLRRTSHMPGVSTGFIAFLSLLRAPSASEQLMPFCVLCGAIAAFLDLTRKLELLVARAVGVSVWGFLAPLILIAVALGILSVTVVNPVSALMRRQADELEARLFGAGGKPSQAGPVWIRQSGVDGQALIKAEDTADGGERLTGVTAFLYGPDNQFEARIEAKEARLIAGVWTLEQVEILTPGNEAASAGVYLLAADPPPGGGATSLVGPEAAPFWELPAWSRWTRTAGLDPTEYELQFQMLLARPLQFVAMVLIAAAFSLRFFRFGGIARMIGGGVGAGFVLYVATKLVGDFGGAGLLSPVVAAWSPAVVASMLGAVALIHQEDG